MPITNRDELLKEIYDQIDRKDCLLPKFQRGFVWNKAKQKSLLASFIVDLPFGSLLYLTGSKADFVTRELCFPTANEETDGTCEFVLDGQQRLSTLRNAFYNLYPGISWETSYSRIYKDLRLRWFLRIKPDEGDIDIFGYRNLRFNGFHAYTDSDLEDFLEAKDIRKTVGLDTPYHPNFAPKDSNGVVLGENAIKNKAATAMAGDSLVPLFEVSLQERGIHNRVVSKIADSRAAELEASLADKNYSPAAIYELFEGIRDVISPSDAEFLVDGKSHDEIRSELRDYFSDLKSRWTQTFSAALNALVERRLPIIQLSKDETHRAVSIFEAINRGGVQLTVFELLAAKSASTRDDENCDLVTNIVDQLSGSIEIPPSIDQNITDDWSPEIMETLNGEDPSVQIKEWFVNVISVLAHSKSGNTIKVEHLKRERILALTREEIADNAELTGKSIIRALAFLNIRCGVLTASDMMYKLILIPLAKVLSADENWLSTSVIAKLEYWYWTSVFAGRYTSRQNERCAQDLTDLSVFAGSKSNSYQHYEQRILNIEGFCTKVQLLRQNNEKEDSPTQVRKAITQYILSQKPFDFVGGAQVALLPWKLADGGMKIDIHHIMPLTGATTIEQSTRDIRADQGHILNSPLNLTPISKEANQKIKDRAPGDYLQLLQDLVLASHCISGASELGQLATAADHEQFLLNRYVLLKQSLNTRLARLKAAF